MSDPKPLAVRLAIHGSTHSDSREICIEARNQLLHDFITINELEARIRYLEAQRGLGQENTDQ